MSSTMYGGVYEGAEYKSLYPHLYRVSYTAVISGRSYEIDEAVAAIDGHHARARATQRHRDIRGTVNVEHLYDLALGG